MKDVFVHDFTYELGELSRTVEEAVAAGQTVSSSEDLRQGGFERHRICGPETNAYDLAHRAISSISERLEQTAAIVYATTLPLNGNLTAAEEYSRSRDVKALMDFPVSHLQSDFELDDAVAIGLNQQACTGLLGSIRIARGLLASEPSFEQILCVTADRFPEDALYEQAYSLISDGASGFLVSRKPRGYRVLASHAITNGAMVTASDDETVGSYFNYTHRLVVETLEKARIGIDDVDWIVPQNTNRTAWEILGRLLGVDPERVFYESLPRVAHVIGGDNVVNLVELQATDRVRSGDRVLLVMAGYGMNWQAVLLERV
jgi:3-oxoacyl-[acyl-carrier-protein] synthase-3